MLGSQLLLVVLCGSVAPGWVSGGPPSAELTLQGELIDDQDASYLLLLRFMSELMASSGDEMLRELDEEEFRGRKRLRRRHVRFAHRERKAGCRNFFWKTFTAC